MHGWHRAEAEVERMKPVVEAASLVAASRQWPRAKDRDIMAMRHAIDTYRKATSDAPR